MQDIISSEFETEVINSSLPVVVDFYAPWCNPCKTLAPILGAFAGQYEGKIKIVKVDIDAEENYEIVTQCSIRSVPTLKFFKNGTSVETIVGMAPKNKLDESFANLAN